jgi:hypothetical protein
VNEPPSGNTIVLNTLFPTGLLNMDYPGDVLEDGVTPSDQTPAPVRRVATTRFEIKPDPADPDHPILYQVTKNALGADNIPEPIAEDIEDLQIAYGVDLNNNRMIEDALNEWKSKPAAADMERVLFVRVTVVARSSQPDPALINRPQTIPGIEDRPEQKDIMDGFRRLILTRIIRLRNVDILQTL